MSAREVLESKARQFAETAARIRAEAAARRSNAERLRREADDDEAAAVRLESEAVGWTSAASLLDATAARMSSEADLRTRYEIKAPNGSRLASVTWFGSPPPVAEWVEPTDERVMQFCTSRRAEGVIRDFCLNGATVVEVRP